MTAEISARYEIPLITGTISPDLESDHCAIFRRRIVRKASVISRFFDFSSKPKLPPDQPVTPIIPARQKIFSRKGEGGS